MTELYLVGRWLRDLKGPERLLNAFRSLKPQVIIGEYSESSAKDYIRMAEERFAYFRALPRHVMRDIIGKAVGISTDRVTDTGLEAFLRTFRYDLWTAHQYYLDTGVELVFPLYDPEEGERKIKTAAQMTGIKPKSLKDRTKGGVVTEAYPESWVRTLLKKSTPMELRHLQREEDEVYKRVFSASDRENEFLNIAFGEQERLLTESALNSIQANKPTVVLCELASLFSNRYDLYQRLRDQNPRIFRLIEFDVNK